MASGGRQPADVQSPADDRRESCPDAQAADLDAQQGEALSVHAGGAGRAAAQGSAAVGVRDHESAACARPASRAQLRRVHARAGLRRLSARLGHPRPGRLRAQVRRLRARVPAARDSQAQVGHGRERVQHAGLVPGGADQHDLRLPAAGRRAQESGAAHRAARFRRQDRRRLQPLGDASRRSIPTSSPRRSATCRAR